MHQSLKSLQMHKKDELILNNMAPQEVGRVHQPPKCTTDQSRDIFKHFYILPVYEITINNSRYYNSKLSELYGQK